MINWKDIRESVQDAILVTGILILLAVVVIGSWAVGSYWASVAW